MRGLRSGDNPARWDGHLNQLLPSRRQLRPSKHFAAMPYAEVPALMATLRQRGGHLEKLLEFIILTASRRGEALGARWDEISAEVWTVPAERMKSSKKNKTGKAHRVPLSPRALAIVEEMRLVKQNEYVFPGTRRETVGETPLRELLLRLGLSVTTHGFRSSFRDWCSEQTNFPRELAEAALAHEVGGQTERAYARGDVLEPRRRLMTAWADYCGRPAGKGATVTTLQPHA